MNDFRQDILQFTTFLIKLDRLISFRFLLHDSRRFILPLHVPQPVCIPNLIVSLNYLTIHNIIRLMPDKLS